jgi:two-component system OmpR family response regulator
MQVVDQHKRISVFVADDSEIVRDRITAMLSEVPAVTIVGYADNPVAATELIMKLNPEVIILDIFLAGGSGIHVLKTIRGKKVTAKVIMLTNYAQEVYRKKCFEEGADFFFDKSIEFIRVVDVISKLLKAV